MNFDIWLIILKKHPFIREPKKLGFEKISEKTGFTRLEIKVLLFLLVVFICGAGLKLILRPNSSEYKNFDYSVQDSLFLNAGKSKINDEITVPDTHKNVDYKQEVLDFRKPDFTERKTVDIPAEKSIDLNTANTKSLIRLPGIGPITAEKIINYRKLKGKFTSLDELLKVKGIGNVKFSKIKKYLYIE